MEIIKIVTSGNEFFIYVYDDSLKLIEFDSFKDKYTANFYLQTLPKKFKIKKAMLVVHNMTKNSIDLLIAEKEDSFFIS